MPMSRKDKEEHDRLVTEFLEKGGTITKCDTGAVTEGAVTSVWKKGPGRPKASNKKED